MAQSPSVLPRAAVLAALLGLGCACMIINCPRGGKRAAGAAAGEDAPLRSCPRCGPGGQGHCYGADICCGDAFGCLLGAAHARPCAEEALSPDPCVDAGLGPRCRGGQGFCAARGLCCTQVSCHADSSCQLGAAGPKGVGPSDVALAQHKGYVYSLLSALAKGQERLGADGAVE